MRHRSVFNIAQVDGVVTPTPAPQIRLLDPSSDIDGIIAATNIKINHVEGSNVYCVPRTDEVFMPVQSSFLGTPTSTAFESY